METLLKVIALLSSGLFAGAALYTTAVEHPARVSQGVLIALQEFRPSYKRAAPLQAGLAVICFLCSVVVWLQMMENAIKALMQLNGVDRDTTERAIRDVMGGAVVGEAGRSAN